MGAPIPLPPCICMLPLPKILKPFIVLIFMPQLKFLARGRLGFRITLGICDLPVSGGIMEGKFGTNSVSSTNT